MNRTTSLLALSSLLFATAVYAYAGRTQDADSYRASIGQYPTVASRLMAATEDASLQGDNCGVDGYPWLSADGQPVEG